MGKILRREDIHWGYLWFFSVIHIVALYGLWYAIFETSWWIIGLAVAFFFLVHLSTTCGAHRYYAHQSFQATRALQWAFVWLFSATFQGPILWWAAKHRHHHTTEDKEDDPHSPQVDGFWRSHMLWMMTKSGLKDSPPKSFAGFRRKNADGSLYFWPAHWQYKNYRAVAIFMTFIVPTIIGFIFGDWLGGALVIGVTRLVFQYHLTWVVNSLGHMWGTRVNKEKHSTNLWLLAVPTVGESFHANHHAWPNDYRLGRKWWEIDLGRYMIEFLVLVRLASEPRIMDNPSAI